MATQMSIDFAVPDLYGIGERFQTFDEAVRHARGRIMPIEGTSLDTREFVDIRRTSATDTSRTDEAISRVEVFRGGGYKVIS